MYEVVLSQEARRAYSAAAVPLARKLARCFARLEAAPRAGNNVKALQGPLAGCFRYRLGDHRVIYWIDDAKHIVSVITIAHRKDAYD